VFCLPSPQIGVGTDLELNQVIEKLYPIIHAEQQGNLKAKK